MHHALQISELLAEIFHFVHFEDLGAAALTCKTFLPSAREEFRYRCLQRPSSLVEAHLPSDLIETAPLRMLSAYSSTDQKPIEQIFPLAQSVVLSIKHSFSTRNNLTHLVADLGQQDPSHMDVAPPPVSTRSDESSYTSDRVQLAKPAYRQYVSVSLEARRAIHRSV
ncbi:hypothetical protein DL93DRAFT_830037 [Clavulina sp. PMI_390]|nr:hypothetical protein DL93DRAFT_830037 [Clavulina sp. PMI_390]